MKFDHALEILFQSLKLEEHFIINLYYYYIKCSKLGFKTKQWIFAY